ncbi:MAG: hypothetical protein NTX56_12930, partial [Proteobacteria bacterium]|nr:hypothetical protein [Pseudomonadota bacterium]
MFPVLGREALVSQQWFAVFLQARRRVGVLGFEGPDEQVEGLVRRLPRRGLPDLLQHLLGLAVQASGHLLEHVGGSGDAQLKRQLQFHDPRQGR